MRPWVAPLLIGVLALALRLPGLGRPDAVVWDEQHFGGFSQDYLHGRYFFDIHPPLGKLIHLAAIRLGGADPGPITPVRAGGDWPSGYPHRAGRVATALGGALVPVLLYLLVLALKAPPRAALYAGLLASADSALLATSRFQFIDPFVHLFVLLGAWLFVLHLSCASRWRWALLVAAGLAAGAAASVKWTGLSGMGLLLAAAGLDAWVSRSWKPLAIRIPGLLIPAVLLYVSLFAVHFALLPRSGPGDAFMSAEFRSTLEGCPEQKRADLVRPGVLARTLELNREMWRANQAKLDHPEQSKFWQWPLASGRVILWRGKDAAERTWMTANPVVWWAGTAAVLATIVLLAMGSPELRPARTPLALLLILWIGAWLPLGLIGRSLYLYHYFTPMLASLGVAGIVFDAVLGKRTGWILVGLAFAVLAFLGPVVWGVAPFPAWSSVLPP